MLVLNTSKDPEMGLLTNSLYVQFYWNLLRIQNGWIHVFWNRAQFMRKTYNALAITCKCNTLLFLMIFLVPDHTFCNKLLYMNTLN